ncbi:MAG: hypothetical protein IJ679_09220 [Lachnospiraceae bacterium]|nr:hypothetical protein [Lachnospiraceae bacterium]
MGQGEESTSKVMTAAQEYDSIFWTGANALRAFIPALVNEAFGEKFTKKAKITFLSNKKVVETLDGSPVRREVDSLFRVSEMFEALVERDYHFECEIRGRRTIALRIVEYASGYAFENVSLLEDGACLKIPYSAVIFLRSESADIKKLTIRVEYPGGEVSYKVPVIRIKDYSLDELFEKRLLVLVPFYFFSFSEREFSEMDRNEERIKEIERMVSEINDRLMQLVEAGEIDLSQKANIMRYSKRVLKKLAGKYRNITKEVDRIMGGYIFKTDVDIAYEEGEIKGREEGEIKGRKEGEIKGRKEGADEITNLMGFLLRNGRNEDALRATTDEEYRTEMLKEYEELAVQG